MISDDIAQARLRLQASLERLNQCTAELNRLAETYAQRAQQERAEGEAELSEFAHSADAPPELRRLQEQIDRWELSWYGALIGEADELIDRSTREFMAGRMAGLPLLGEAVRSGASAQEAAELAAAQVRASQQPDGVAR